MFNSISHRCLIKRNTMKKNIILLILASQTFGVSSQEYIYVHKKDGTTLPFPVDNIEEINYVKGTDSLCHITTAPKGFEIKSFDLRLEKTISEMNDYIKYLESYNNISYEDMSFFDERNNAKGHEYVDLGLPSGRKWAKCNLGAEKESEVGEYYRWLPFQYGYAMSYKDIAYTSTDPVHEEWGTCWKMPTKGELQELIDNCVWTKVTIDSVAGYRVEGPNKNYIFLPIAGYKDGFSIYKPKNLYYLSSTQHVIKNLLNLLAYTLKYDDKGLRVEYDYTNNIDYLIRPVYSPLEELHVAQTDSVSDIVNYIQSTTNGLLSDIKEYLDTQIQLYENANADTIPAYLDLGLPSGNLWATCNVGASSPEEYGDYFSYGETSTKLAYEIKTSKFYPGKTTVNPMTIVDSISGTEYDAARMNLGEGWVTPTKKDFEELGEYCTFEESDYCGIEGVYVTGPNGNRLFFPFSGSMDGDRNSGAGYYPHYMLGNLYDGDHRIEHNVKIAKSMYFDGVDYIRQDRNISYVWKSFTCGLPVRAIRRK